MDHAVELNKRIVPLAFRGVPDEQVPEGIRVRNWIPVGDGDFDSGVDRLVQALDTDLEWDREHTHWLLKALEWDESGRDRSFLLRGSELAAAEGWLAASADRDPGPTALQREYVFASRAAATRRQRVVVGASLGIAAVSIALLVFALISRHAVVNERTTAKSRALAGQSGNQLAVDPELSLLLAREAVRTKPTPDALFALRRALDESPLRLDASPAGPPGLSARELRSRARLQPAAAGSWRPLQRRRGAPERRDRTGSRRAGTWRGTAPARRAERGRQATRGCDRGRDRASRSRHRRDPQAAAGRGAVKRLAFSPDGSLVAGATEDGGDGLEDRGRERPAPGTGPTGARPSSRSRTTAGS